MPDEALVNLTLKLQKFEPNITAKNLKSELISFSVNWKYLKHSVSESYPSIIQSDSDEDGVDNDDNEIKNNKCKTLSSCKKCAVCCFNVLMKYKLYCDAYSNLTLAYKYLLTLPSTQVSYHFSNI